MTSRYDDRDLVRDRLTRAKDHRLDRKRKARALWIIHYTTPELRHPTSQDWDALAVKEYIWKYGDKFYKTAAEEYGDPTLWWIIAWFNQKPTEAHALPGDIIYIPHPLDAVFAALGV